MEGGLRAPFIIRWPGYISAGVVSDEIVHVSDMYTTLATIGGACDHIPTDRPVDGKNMTKFFCGESKSPREGLVYYIKQDMRAVKWRDWKLHYYWEPEVNQSKGKLESPMLFHLVQDPKEETNIAMGNNWALGPIHKLVAEFNQSLKDFPPIPPGTLDPYTPPWKRGEPATD